MRKNIVYDNITTSGDLSIGGRPYNIENDFPHCVLFLRIEKSNVGYEVMLSVKSELDALLPLFHESVVLTVSDDLFNQADSFQDAGRSIDGNLNRGVGKATKNPINEVTVGNGIYSTFFSGDIGKICFDFLDLLQANKIRELLIVISSEDERIQNLPWEMILPKLSIGVDYDFPKDNFGLIRSREKTLERFNIEIFPDDKYTAPLKMLFIPALPENLSEREKLLEIEDEQRKIIEAVRTLEATGDQYPKLVIEILDSANLAEIKEALKKRKHDIVHISGHGAYSKLGILGANSKLGTLLLEDEVGNEQQITGHDLGLVLRESASVKLVVLNACETAVGGPEGSTAEQIAAIGIPAVLAMRFSVTDRGARLFSEAFYQRLTAGDRLTKAIHDARQVLWHYVQQRRKDAPQVYTPAEWFTPVLYQNQAINALVKPGLYNNDTLGQFYPKPSNLKLGNTPLVGEGFIGRKRLMIQLRQCFSAGKHVCLHGLGGLGKTTTAEAFADLYQKRNGHDILFFRYGPEIQEAIILEKIYKRWKSRTEPHADVAEELKALLDNPKNSLESKLQLLINNCLKGRRNILIFDNFEDIQTDVDGTQQQEIGSKSLQLFLSYLLRNAPQNCHLLFTTRYKIANVEGLVTHLAVEKMTYAEQYRYINFSQTLRTIPSSQRDILDRRINGHPRALQYLEELVNKDQNFDLTILNTSIDQVESRIFENLLLSRIYNQLSSTEKEVLTIASVFTCRSPLEVLSNVSSKHHSELTPLLIVLRDWSLCFWNEKEQVFEIHVLTRIWMRKQNYPNHERFKSLSYKIGEFYKNKFQSSNEEIFLEKSYFEQAEALPEYASAASLLAENYKLAGLYTAARDLMHEVLMKNISLRMNGTAFSRLGEISSLMNDYGQSYKYYEQSLQIHRQIGYKKGEAAALNNLGSYYSKLGEPDKALKYYKESLKIQESEFTEEDITTYATHLQAQKQKIITLSNLGQLNSTLGNYDEAIKYFKQSLTVDTMVGKEEVFNNIGDLYYKQGKYKWALETWQQALELARVVGAQKTIATVLCNMGVLFFRGFQDVSKAIPLFLDSFVIFNEIDSSEAHVPASWFDLIMEEIGEEKFNQIIKSIENN